MQVSVITCSKIALEAQAVFWPVYKALQRGGKREKTLRPVFCVWVWELHRHVSRAN